MEESILYFSIILLCGLLFIGLGIFALKKKTPMHFWAGSVVKPEEITDFKSYNKAIGIMWIIYAIMFILSGFSALIWDIDIVAIISTVAIVFGTILLMVVYSIIYNKYKVK